MSKYPFRYNGIYLHEHDSTWLKKDRTTKLQKMWKMATGNKVSKEHYSVFHFYVGKAIKDHKTGQFIGGRKEDIVRFSWQLVSGGGGDILGFIDRKRNKRMADYTEDITISSNQAICIIERSEIKCSFYEDLTMTADICNIDSGAEELGLRFRYIPWIHY